MPTAISDMSLSDLERLIAKRRHEIDRLLRKRRKLEAKLDKIDQQIAALGGNGAAVGRRGSRPRNAVSLNEAIASVLEKASKPLGVPEITQKVLATGYRSSSPAFKSIVNQTLIKDKRFKAIARGIYQRSLR